jgi:hypothetical protein
MRSKEQKQIYLNKSADANLRNVTADNAVRKKTGLPGRQPRCKHIRGPQQGLGQGLARNDALVSGTPRPQMWTEFF